jgi:adenine-specific DNA glycosylase
MVDQLLAWYGQNRRDLPWRETHDPYAILVSEVIEPQRSEMLYETIRIDGGR